MSMKTITLMDSDKEGGWDTGGENLKNYIAKLQAYLDSAPEEYQDETAIEHYTNDYLLSCRIYYERFETAEDRLEEENKQKRRDEQRRVMEIEKLKELRNKYPEELS